MALEPGGYADKLGNRYEGRWVALQLLLLLNEQCRSITLEPVGDDETGVDLWIERNDGLREAQQCKAENGNKPNWTLNDLKNRQVLERLRSQLDRDSRHRFTFVSSSPATQLRDLTRSATDSTGHPESFYFDQIQNGSQNRQESFTDWCRNLTLDERSVSDRRTAFDLLRRSNFYQFSDHHQERELLRCLATQLVVGDAEIVLALLANFAADRPRVTIVATDIWQLLKGLGLLPRKLTADERNTPRIEELNADFDESIRPHLAGGKLIPRIETVQLLDLLSQPDCPDVIILHGKAGHGKSGILYQAISQLKERSVPLLALRLDRKRPSGSPRKFGMDLGLRESPVNCLAHVSDTRPAVLILDQLDALRWTSSHASDGLDVCKAMLREARAIRYVGKRLTVVLCCRTFDLDHDPEIKVWLKPSALLQVRKIAVQPLAVQVVKQFVESMEVSYDRMNIRHKSLLQSIHNLSIWATIVNSGEKSPEFDSGTGLMRAFWANRRRELEKSGFASPRSGKLLDQIVDHMEANGVLAAPVRLVEQDDGLVTELQSLNIINVDRRSISFCHQSYLDFLIANRALERVHSTENGLLQWLGDKARQSLFRREQLRQLLFLLADEDPRLLSEILNFLFNAAEVRFHLKQLALEAISQLRPVPELVQRIVTMFEDREWRIHVLHDVLFGNVEWINAFHGDERLFQMLFAKSDADQNNALWLMCSVIQTSPHFFSSALKLFKKTCESTEPLKALLHYTTPHTEPDEIFDFRLSSLATDVNDHYIAWKELLPNSADRALQLLATLIRRSPQSWKRHPMGGQFGVHGKEEFNAFVATARCEPMAAIRWLGPCLIRIVRQKLKEKLRWRNRRFLDELVTWPSTEVPKLLLALIKAALSRLAEVSSEQFIRLRIKLERYSSRAVQDLLVCASVNLDASYSDQTILWLLSDPRRLRAGSQKRRPRWCSAARLIRRISSNCSSETFFQLEQFLLHYHDPDEKRHAAYWLEAARYGRFVNGFLAAQHFLLPALAPARSSIQTTGRIGVLNRKFANHPKEYFLGPRSKGGWVSSPLNKKTLTKISDRQWLRIVASKTLKKTESSDGHKYFRNHVIDSSVLSFSRDFGIAARCQPERFARLALKIPEFAPPDYLTEVLRALSRKAPPDGLPSEMSETWQPGSRECAEAVIEQLPFSEDFDLRRSFCSLVSDRQDIRLSSRAIELLIDSTRHAHPGANQLFVGCDKTADDADIDELEQNTINCVRSLAAMAIGSVLYDNQHLFASFRPALETLISDSHPVVRMSCVDFCLPIWNFDERLAVEWFIKCVGLDNRIACGRRARQFLNCAFAKSGERLSPIIYSMCESTNAKIAQEGAAGAAARWILYEQFPELVLECRTGSEALRKGVAEVVGQMIREDDWTKKCEPVFLELCEDASEEVRNLASRCIYHAEFLRLFCGTELISKYVKTKAFNDDPDRILRAFEEFQGSLIPIANLIFEIIAELIEIICSPDRTSDRRMPMVDTQISKLLLRLYGQSSEDYDKSIASRCLDMVDQLLKHRIASARTLIDEIEL
jgi:hypothetical protein